MAEFCLDCWNALNESDEKAYKFVLSAKPDYCEECGCYRKIILSERKIYFLHKLVYEWKDRETEKELRDRPR